MNKEKNCSLKDIHSETSKLSIYIGFGRARDYDLPCLLKCELCEIPLFLVEDVISRTCDNKSKLERATEGKLEHQQNYTFKL